MSGHLFKHKLKYLAFLITMKEAESLVGLLKFWRQHVPLRRNNLNHLLCDTEGCFVCLFLRRAQSKKGLCSQLGVRHKPSCSLGEMT